MLLTIPADAALRHSGCPLEAQTQDSRTHSLAVTGTNHRTILTGMPPCSVAYCACLVGAMGIVAGMCRCEISTQKRPAAHDTTLVQPGHLVCQKPCRHTDSHLETTLSSCCPYS